MTVCDGSAGACAGLSEAVAAARAIRPQQVPAYAFWSPPLVPPLPSPMPRGRFLRILVPIVRNCGVCVWQVLLVGMTCSIGDHAATNRRLRRLWTHPKPGVEPLDIQLAHDGLVLHFGQ